MSDAVPVRPLQGWQRTNVLTAANYLRDLLVSAPADARLRAVHDGLLEALDPSRRAVRLQRESATAASAAAAALRVNKRSGLDRRCGERRTGVDRRVVHLGAPAGVDRRLGERRQRERRSGKDRRR